MLLAVCALSLYSRIPIIHAWIIWLYNYLCNNFFHINCMFCLYTNMCVIVTYSVSKRSDDLVSDHLERK